MSADVIDLSPYREAKNLGRSLENMGFGSCPICRSCDEVVTVRLTYWGLCIIHRLRWRIGDSQQATLPEVAERIGLFEIHQPHRPEAVSGSEGAA